MKKAILLIFTLFTLNPIFAQNKKVLDSLNRVYQSATADTVKILVLNRIAFAYMSSKPDTCITLAEKALQMSEKINFEKGKGTAYTMIGIGNEIKGNYLLALEYYQKGLNIRERMGDKQGIAKSLNNIGLTYRKLGKYPEALSIHLQGLKIEEELGNREGISSNLNNIGIIYRLQNNDEKALEYYQKSLKIDEELHDQENIATSLNNIGMIYKKQGKQEKALEYYQKSLKIQEEVGNQEGVGNSLINIGIIYSEQGKDEKALEYNQKSLQVYEKIGDKLGQAYSLDGIAIILAKQNNYDQSIEYAQKGLKISQEIKSMAGINRLSQTLYRFYKDKADYLKALEYHELHKTTNDRLFTIEKTKVLANLEAKVDIERKEKEIVLLSKDKELLEKNSELKRIEAERQRNARLIIEKQAETERLLALAQHEKDLRKQDSLYSLAKKSALESENLKAKENQLKAENQAKQLEVEKTQKEKIFQERINYLIGAGLLVALVFVYLIHRSRQREKMAKEMVLLQKEEIQQQHEELQQTLQIINEQKTVIENKNTNIIASITYAKRIQTAILPFAYRFEKVFGAENYFIFFRPRDIVSGDFYFLETIETAEKTLSVLAVADCTGHGVPGAFMSMVGNQILNEAILKNALHEPAQILQFLRGEVRRILQQHENDSKDGMDIIIVTLTKSESLSKLAYAGAMNSLYYVQNQELTEIKATKLRIGGNTLRENETYEQHEIPYTPDTFFYLSSDGYQDQFGGEQDKKFMSKNFKTLLLEISSNSMPKQKQILEQTFDKWKDKGEQTDDVLVVGLRV